MDVGLYIEMTVDPQGQVTSRFRTEGIALCEVGPAVDKAIASLTAERGEMPLDHAPKKPITKDVLAERLRNTFQAMANSTTPHAYHTGAKALVGEVERALYIRQDLAAKLRAAFEDIAVNTTPPSIMANALTLVDEVATLSLERQ